jgi:hypothetical protein
MFVLGGSSRGERVDTIQTVTSSSQVQGSDSIFREYKRASRFKSTFLPVSVSPETPGMYCARITILEAGEYYLTVSLSGRTVSWNGCPHIACSVIPWQATLVCLISLFLLFLPLLLSLSFLLDFCCCCVLLVSFFLSFFRTRALSFFSPLQLFKSTWHARACVCAG